MQSMQSTQMNNVLSVISAIAVPRIRKERIVDNQGNLVICTLTGNYITTDDVMQSIERQFHNDIDADAVVNNLKKKGGEFAYCIITSTV